MLFDDHFLDVHLYSFIFLPLTKIQSYHSITRNRRALNGLLYTFMACRVPCNYPGRNVAFHVDAGSNSYYLAVVVEFEDGDGDLAGLDLHQASSSPTSDSKAWISMQQSWGADWKLNSGSTLEPPFSFKLTSDSGKTLVASNVIPSGWQPGATYRSVVNFKT